MWISSGQHTQQWKLQLLSKVPLLYWFPGAATPPQHGHGLQGPCAPATRAADAAAARTCVAPQLARRAALLLPNRALQLAPLRTLPVGAVK